jgi:hypothetical protein
VRLDKDSPDDVAGGIDLIALVKAVAIGFVVLVLGGLVAGQVIARLPLSSGALTVTYNMWVVAVTLGAFAWAGSRIGEATRPAVHGGVTALGAYVLVVPLVLLGGSNPPVTAVLLMALVALVVGGLSGLVAGRRRGTVLP